MKYDDYAKQFLKNINDCIDDKTKEYVTIKSATVSKVNDSGTVDVEFPEDGGSWSNVTNQSIYQNLKVGDEVKLIQQNGASKNCWIIGALQTSKKQNILQQVNETIEKKEQNNNSNGMYVEITQEFVSVPTTAPTSLSISASSYPHKFCILTVVVNGIAITDYLYYSKRENGSYVWKSII